MVVLLGTETSGCGSNITTVKMPRGYHGSSNAVVAEYSTLRRGHGTRTGTRSTDKDHKLRIGERMKYRYTLKRPGPRAEIKMNAYDTKVELEYTDV